MAQLIEQPRVLDGDDGLRGERPQERKLLIRKRPRRMAHDAEQANCLIAAHHWGDCDRPVTAGQEVPGSGSQFGRSIPRVRNVHDLAIEHGCTTHVLPREGGTGNRASPRFGALGITLSNGRGINPIANLGARLMRASGKSFWPLCTMASNTGWASAGELLMMFRMSAIAACCSNASLNSRLRRATLFSSLAGEKSCRRKALDASRRLSVNDLRRRVLAALSRCPIAAVVLRTWHRNGSNMHRERAPTHVRFGSKADI